MPALFTHACPPSLFWLYSSGSYVHWSQQRRNRESGGSSRKDCSNEPRSVHLLLLRRTRVFTLERAVSAAYRRVDRRLHSGDGGSCQETSESDVRQLRALSLDGVWVWWCSVSRMEQVVMSELALNGSVHVIYLLSISPIPPLSLLFLSSSLPPPPPPLSLSLSPLHISLSHSCQIHSAEVVLSLRANLYKYN